MLDDPKPRKDKTPIAMDIRREAMVKEYYRPWTEILKSSNSRIIELLRRRYLVTQMKSADIAFEIGLPIDIVEDPSSAFETLGRYSDFQKERVTWEDRPVSIGNDAVILIGENQRL
ncbi:MAG: hypothetical protein IPH10_08625 [bacterium]|nr:hypothetical protein [bacterium]